tara:strand:+ start:9220 stop:9711 length:492 start_codon:yes stop_codon:yes gene_type:complete
MPSFDIVSSFDMQEIDNAVNMVVRDIANRYDFRGSKTSLTLDKGEKKITIEADNTMQLAAVVDMLKSRAISRKISLKVFKFHDEESAAGTSIRQTVSLKEGIDKDKAKKINKMIKDKKLKVQSQIQGEQLRVTGKKIDDLQSVISMLKSADLDIDLQYVNMKS